MYQNSSVMAAGTTDAAEASYSHTTAFKRQVCVYETRGRRSTWEM